LPPQLILVTPTGTTPRASRLSGSLVPRVTTRLGSLSIVVEPKVWSMVTGNAASSTAVVAAGASASVARSSVEPVLQPATRPVVARPRTGATSRRRGRTVRGTGSTCLLDDLGEPYLSCIASVGNPGVQRRTLEGWWRQPGSGDRSAVATSSSG